VAGAGILLALLSLGSLAVAVVGIVALARALGDEVVTSVPGAGGAIGALVFLVLLFLALAILGIIATARVFALRRSGRIMGIVAASISLLPALLIVLGSISRQEVDPESLATTATVSVGGLLVGLAATAAGVAVIVILTRAGRAFHRP
jgi:hypothetical protein